MSRILSAKPVVQAMKGQLQEEVSKLKAGGFNPTLGIIRVGDRPDDVYYENSIIKNCQGIGIDTRTYPLDSAIGMEEFTRILRDVNQDTSIHGILIFRPLPKQLDENVIKYIIDPDKDIDCMNPFNLAKVFEGDMSGLVPCTPAAVMETLKHYDIGLEGANVVIMGRSLVVGKPLSMMMLKDNATVTVCHSKTNDLQGISKQAGIIVAAMGKAKLVDENYVTENSIVIDVGINDAGEGKICGDVDYDAVVDRVDSITPVPGGIGSVTTTILLKHVVIACKTKVKK